MNLGDDFTRRTLIFLQAGICHQCPERVANALRVKLSILGNKFGDRFAAEGNCRYLPSALHPEGQAAPPLEHE